MGGKWRPVIGLEALQHCCTAGAQGRTGRGINGHRLAKPIACGQYVVNVGWLVGR